MSQRKHKKSQQSTTKEFQWSLNSKAKTILRVYSFKNTLWVAEDEFLSACSFGFPDANEFENFDFKSNQDKIIIFKQV